MHVCIRFALMNIKLKCILLLLFLPSMVLAQGKSFFKVYSPKEYDAHAQNWCIIQDKAGLVYFGNTIGLLIYDGKKWQSVKLNNSIVRSLAKDENDRIYYGAQGEFGYLSANKNGVISHTSLSHLLPDSLRMFGDVWKTYCLNDKVVFQTFDHIFVYQHGKISVAEPENYYHFGYQRNSDFYIIDREIGLKKLKGNKLELPDGGAFFANLRIYGWINYDEYALVITREKGVFKVRFNNNNSIVTEPFKTEIDEALIDDEVYCATALNNGDVGVGTLNQGVFVIDSTGKLLKVINKKNYELRSNIINALFMDRQMGLWMAMDVGIARVEINSGFEFLSENDGLEGLVNSITEFEGKLFAGTNKGLFEVAKNGVKKNTLLNSDVRHIISTKINNNNVLLIVSESGTYQLDSKGNLKTLNEINGFFISESNYHNGQFFIGANEGFSVYNSINNLLKNYDEPPMPEVREIVEESDSVLWIGTTHNGVFKISDLFKDSYKVQFYDTSKGLPSNTNNLPFRIKGKVYFATLNGIYIYNPSKNSFEVDHELAQGGFTNEDQIFRIVEGFNDKVWLFKTSSILHEFISFNLKTKQLSFPLRRMGEFDAYFCIYPENEHITWLGGPDGLFRYDASKPAFDKIKFNTIFRGVYCNYDTLYGGYPANDATIMTSQNGENIPELKYKNNNISFEFAALCFDNEKENVFSYYLEGFDKSWSEWTSESKKSYTNLNEGVYTFHIKSKNVYGTEGQEDTYTFIVLAPWYRTGWAYFAYVIGAIVMVYFITQISVRRLKRAKIKLEAIVINRTAEVVAEKEEVEKQKKIIEIKNKDITDSINYAQKIQQAILPLPEDFSRVFPEAFIFFQPRDIVSGDFYWFYRPNKIEKNWVYIAAADCTGHGVPGAFMSMIGNTLLNEILNEKQIYETDLILNQLHLEVRSALKQDIAQNTTNDGMDIALCRIDLDTLEIQYSGANRALYIFKNTENKIEFIDIKPNKFPIGGYQAELTRSFTAHNIQLNSKDTFYIFSDGYADQFGGTSNKKFMVKRLQNELLAMQHLPMKEQEKLVKKLVMDWKGDAEQVDDILMIGVRI